MLIYKEESPFSKAEVPDLGLTRTCSLQLPPVEKENEIKFENHLEMKYSLRETMRNCR